LNRRPVSSRSWRQFVVHGLQRQPGWHTVPADLRRKLRDAVISLDPKRISETIDKVAEHDTALRSALAGFAERCSSPRS
jgi:hypothetical protein